MHLKYLHYFGNESSESLLEAYGIETKSKQLCDTLRPKQCPNCNEPNKPDSKFCAKCRMVLTYDAYNEAIEEKENKDKQIEVLIKKQEKFEQLIQSLIDSEQLRTVNSNKKNILPVG
jgi:predicted amidophosphoribosyltransferase